MVEKKIVLILLLIMVSISGLCLDYYIQAEYVDTNGIVFLNGFPIGNIDERESHFVSRCVTNLLKNGKNRIDVIYSPNRNSSISAKLKWELYSTPDNENINSKNAIKILDGQYNSIRRINVADYSTLPDKLTLTVGTFDKNKRMIFDKIDNKAVLSGKFNIGYSFNRLPSQIEYGSISTDLEKVKVHFMKSGTIIDVVYSNMSLKSDGSVVDLLIGNISSGMQWVNETDFDEILIEGIPFNDKKEVSMWRFGINQIQGIIKDSKEFTITNMPDFIGYKADSYDLISEKDKSEILAVIQSLQESLINKNLDNVEGLMSTKKETYKLMTHKDIKDLDKNFKQLFQSFFTKDDWGMTPLNKNNIRYILYNDKIVGIKDYLGKDIIKSIPFKDESGQQSSFSMTLYFSHINGKWVIIF